MAMQKESFDNMKNNLKSFNNLLSNAKKRQDIVNMINKAAEKNVTLLGTLKDYEKLSKEQAEELYPEMDNIVTLFNNKIMNLELSANSDLHTANNELQKQMTLIKNLRNEKKEEIKEKEETKDENKEEIKENEETKVENKEKIKENEETKDEKKIDEIKTNEDKIKEDEDEIKKMEEEIIKQEEIEIKKAEETCEYEIEGTNEPLDAVEDKKKQEIKENRIKEMEQAGGFDDQLGTIDKKANDFRKKAGYNPETDQFEGKGTSKEGYKKGAQAANNLLICMTKLKEWYVESKITKDEFVSCAKYVLGNEDDGATNKTKFDAVVSNNSNENSDDLKHEKDLMMNVRTDVIELKQHRGWGKTLTDLLDKCISIAPGILAAPLNFFKPSGTKAGKQADKLLDTIKNETPKVGK